MNYSARCPCCGYEHDFETKAEMDQMWKRWMGAIRRLLK